MQGIFVTDGLDIDRPRSKKQVRELAAADPSLVLIEATSMFGNEYNGSLAGAPDGEIHFVGPCPYTKRNFYGTITKRGDKVTVK